MIILRIVEALQKSYSVFHEATANFTRFSWIDERPTYIWTTKRGTARGMEWYYVLTVIFRFELESLDFMPTQECREIKFFSKEDLEEHAAELGSQIVPLVQAFDSEDFTDDEVR